MSILDKDKILNNILANKGKEVFSDIQDKIANNETLSNQEKLLVGIKDSIAQNKIVKEGEHLVDVTDEQLRKSIETFADVIDDFTIQTEEEAKKKEQIKIAKRLKKLDFDDDEIRMATKLTMKEIKNL